MYLTSFFTGLRRLELASLTPRSFRLDDAQPTLIVEAACSKHRRKDTLPMHPELVALVREWIAGLEPDEPLFPRLARKKTYTMVQKDLERAGIPYETHEGVADFHAAGRHSHITGLIASGASIMEAKELARHADIRQTAKYTHIGMRGAGPRLWPGCNIPRHAYPLNCRKYVGFRAASCVRRFHGVTVTATARVSRKTRKPLRRKGFRRFLSLTFRSCQLT